MVVADSRPAPIRYLVWHYGSGLKSLREILANFLVFFYHFFSLPLLAKTLFAPWKRAIRKKRKPGISVDEIGERVSFNIISRIIGFIVRSCVIVAGILCIIVTSLAGLLVVCLWLITPGLSLLFYIADTDNRELRRLIRDPDVHTMLTRLIDTHFGKFFLSRLSLSRTAFLSATDKTMEVHIPGELIGKEHKISALFLLLYQRNTTLQQYLFELGVTDNDVRDMCAWYDRLNEQYAYEHQFWNRERLLRLPSIGKNWTYGYTPTLDNVTSDLALEPLKNDSYRARKKEITQIDQCISKRTVNSVLLVGESGVGKHPLLIYLAHEIAAGRVLPQLEGKRLLYVKLEQLYNGETDATSQKALLSAILQEASGAGNIILVLDEFDRFISSGPDRIDFSDVVVHNISDGTLQIIAMVTPEAYHRFIKPNLTLCELFEIVTVESLTADQTLPVLLDQLVTVEHNRLWFQFQAVKEIVQIADRYMHDAPFPEKALVLLDDIAAAAEIGQTAKVLSVADVRTLAASKLGIPLALERSDKNVLLHLESHLHDRVVGQEEAITAIAKALRRARANADTQSNRPIGCFLFLGPTGVGKTETAKALSYAYFGKETALQRFDMAQFNTGEATKQLIGDFASGKVGIFTERLHDHPACIVLLDEFEKADKEIHNIFLTAFDEGYITDAFGKNVYLTNTIIIATSNAGSEKIRELISNTLPPPNLTQLIVEHVQRAGILSPELLNRFDDVIVFHPLSTDHTAQILDLSLRQYNKTVKERHGITVTLSETTRHKLLEAGFNAEYGGRALRRAFQEYVENTIAEKVLKGEIHRGTEIAV